MDGGATPTLLVTVDLLIFVPQVALEFYSINVVLKFAYLIQKVTLTNAVLLDLIGADQFILIKIRVRLLNKLAMICELDIKPHALTGPKRHRILIGPMKFCKDCG